MTYAPDYPADTYPSEEYDYEPPFDADSGEPPDEVRFLDEPPEEYDYELEPFYTAPAPGQAALPGFEAPPSQEWTWLDACFVGLEQRNAEGKLSGYEVGCVDLYTNTVTGDLGGSFLRVQSFKPEELGQAENLLNRLNGYD